MRTQAFRLLEQFQHIFKVIRVNLFQT